MKIREEQKKDADGLRKTVREKEVVGDRRMRRDKPQDKRISC